MKIYIKMKSGLQITGFLAGTNKYTINVRVSNLGTFDMAQLIKDDVVVDKIGQGVTAYWLVQVPKPQVEEYQFII